MNEAFKKIISQIGALANYNGDAYLDSADVIEIVQDVAEEYKGGWIACSDRLPTAEEYQRGNGRFLVTDGNRTYEAEFDIYESHTFGKSRMATDWFITDKCVTHWQNEPLPPQP